VQTWLEACINGAMRICTHAFAGAPTRATSSPLRTHKTKPHEGTDSADFHQAVEVLGNLFVRGRQLLAVAAPVLMRVARRLSDGSISSACARFADGRRAALDTTRTARRS